MFLSEEKRHNLNSKTTRKVTWYILKCDQCNEIYERKSNINHKRAKYNFCSYDCQIKSQNAGALKISIRESFFKKYGSASCFSDPAVLARRQKTMIDRYGSKNNYKKIRKTLEEKYNVTSPLQIKEIKDKIREKSIKDFGVEHHLMSQDIIDKRIKTMIEKYGVTNAYQIEHIAEKATSKESQVKRHQTMKKNKSYSCSSKIEIQFFDDLKKIFGDDNVVHAYPLNGWFIDFYIKSLSLFIEFDGVYWHGIDRDLPDIIFSESSRDKIILEHYINDCVKDEYFMSNKLSYLRIKDIDYKKDGIDVLKRYLDIDDIMSVSS